MLLHSKAFRIILPIVLTFQVVPLMLLTAENYSLDSQVWWLPVLLAIIAIIALVQLFTKKHGSTWSWKFLIFSQGVNVITRIMMLMSSGITLDQQTKAPSFHTGYIVFSLVAMALSIFYIWFIEKPEVRNVINQLGFERSKQQPQHAAKV